MTACVLTPKMRVALALLADHGISRDKSGEGVVTTGPTGLDSGQPWINFRTARALERRGLVRVDYSCEAEVALTAAGWDVTA